MAQLFRLTKIIIIYTAAQMFSVNALFPQVVKSLHMHVYSIMYIFLLHISTKSAKMPTRLQLLRKIVFD